MDMNLDPAAYPRSGDVIVPGVATAGAVEYAAPIGPVPIYSPEWWLRRLMTRLQSRARICKGWYDYYAGDQPLAFASEKFNTAYGQRYRQLPANFMPLVVDAERERLIVQGFRFGKNEADRGVWKIWQDNQLDAESMIAHEIALTKGVAYAMVAPGPSVTIEDPMETIVETAPGNRRTRLAALKVWHDDDGYFRAYLYLPDYIYKYQSSSTRSMELASDLTQIRWEPGPLPDEDWPVRNPIGVVPIIPLLNRPLRSGIGRSEIEPVIGNQSAINFLRFAALVGADTSALPQRWAKNIEVPIDPDTGVAEPPFRSGRDVLWIARRPTPEEVQEYGDQFPDPAFGQFPAADLRPFVDMIREEIGQMSSISRTPYHYLLGTPSSVPPSGESLKASEAPLVKKVGAQAIHFGEGWEETMRVALLASGQGTKARADGETIWADPETRNEAARTDSILKQYAAGLLPDEVAWEELGYSPQQIERMKALREAEKAAQPEATNPIPAPTAAPAADATPFTA